MERTAEQIRLYARLGFLIYADGYTAKIGGMRPSKDQHGNDVWKFLLEPTDELIKRYNLKANQKGDMTYIAEYPYELVIQLNIDPVWTRWLYLRTYDGKLTPEIEKLEGTKQQEFIKDLKYEIRTLKMKLEVATEKLKLMQTDMPKYLDRNFKPMMEQMIPIMEKLLKKGE